MLLLHNKKVTGLQVAYFYGFFTCFIALSGSMGPDFQASSKCF